ncbi:MAG: hypothetical protein QF415_12835 [Candidatus Undinarchaeales archaeon]|jgi:hypothetical protein|nr:hypothetical protein [Candidatus Undinarchaeales archaeon]
MPGAAPPKPVEEAEIPVYAPKGEGAVESPPSPAGEESKRSLNEELGHLQKEVREILDILERMERLT